MSTVIRQRGIVLDRVTLNPLSGARVEAWDAEGQIGRLVARAMTDDDGAFELRMTDGEIAALFGGREVAVFLRVVAGGQVVADTEEIVRWLPGREQPLTRIYAAARGPSAPADTFLVTGRVLEDGSGSPSDVDVKVYDVAMDGDVLLGEATGLTMPARYTVTFAANAIISGKRLPDLRVEVWEHRGDLLNTSEIRFQAGPVSVVDVAVNPSLVAGTSELERTTAAIGPVMGAAAPRVLDDAQVHQVAQSAEIAPARVRAMAKADAIAASFSGAISAEALYGLARQGQPETYEGIVATRRAELRAALERSADAGQTALSPAQITTQLTSLRNEAVSAAQGTGGFGPLLGAAGLASGDRAALLEAYMEHEGPAEAFWASLSLDPNTKAAAQTFLRAGAVVRYHVPLLEAVAVEWEIASFEELAAFDERDWSELMVSQGIPLPAGLAGADDSAKIENWSKLIVRTVASALPTRYLAARLSDDRKTFLDNNPVFDFRKHRVATYFATESPNLGGVSDVEALKRDLARTERMLKLTPRAEQVIALETAGFTSARSIARYGKQRFVAKHASALDGTKAAELIYHQAVRQAHKAAHLFAKLNPALNGPWMPFLANLDAPPSEGDMMLLSETASSAFESYFGHPALCSCARCAAVHGPAAYFVALLVWLDRFETSAMKVGGAATARDLLLGAAGLDARRPDLGYLELTCDNVDGALPYIDVVNEILEWRVAGVTPSAPIGTGGTLEDRLGAPEILDESAFSLAYEKLAASPPESPVYPFVLPWSLWLEQARRYLRHLGVERHKLMEILRAPGEPSASTDSAIAAEHLAIHPLTWEIVAAGTVGGRTPAELWGMGDHASWAADLQADAALFMERAQIESYEELLELFDASAVREPFVAFASDPSLSPHPALVRCDLSQVSIVGVASGDAPAFFAWIQRVVRLRHALGWRFADVDKLFRLAWDLEASPPAVDFDVLIAAARGADELEKELAIPRVEALAFWGALDDHPMTESGLPTLVDRLFRARSAGPLLDDNLPSPLSGTIAEHTQAIRAGLGIDAEALSLLTNGDAAGVLFLDAPVAGATLDLESLTTLFRYARLARALRLHVAELMVFVALSATTPFETDARPRELAREIRALAAVGLSADLVHFLLRHVERPRRGVPSHAAEIEKHAAAVATATETALAATKAPAKVAKEDLRGELYAALDAVADPDLDPDTRAARLADDTEYVLGIVDDLTVEPADAGDRRDRLEAILGAVFDDPAPIAQFLVPQHPKDLASCRVWCDDSEPYTAGTWPNQAPGGASVSQATAGSRPASEGAPFGGIRFDGIDDYLDVALSHASESHTFAVAAVPEVTSGPRALLEVPGSFICAAQTATDAQVGFAHGATPTWENVGDLAWGMQALLFRLDGAASETGHIYRNGEPVSTTARPFVSGLTFTNARLGGSTSAGVEPYQGVIQAFGVFDAALGATDLARVNGFIALLQQRQQDRIAFVYRALRDVVHRREVASAVKKRASERLGISEAMGAQILTRLNAVETPENDATSLFDSLRPPSVGGHRLPDPGASDESHIDALTRFSKVALLAEKLSLSVLDLDWLLARTEEGWLDLNTLPVQPPVEPFDLEGARKRYAALLQLVDILALAPHFVDGRAGMYDLSARAAEAPPPAELMAAVAAQTRWEGTELLALHTRLIDGVSPYVDLTGFLKIAPAAEALRRLGVSAATAVQWLDPSESTTDAQATALATLKAARAKHTLEAWDQIAPGLRDPVREKQREALVAHLIQAKGLSGPDDLYDALLIDVEMSACQKVSRIRAALNSVQLFVHRAMLGLEPSWTPNKDARAQWEWRKIFTLWEANRKVFLSPEDFVEPELRDDKTPLFSQLEADLRQGDLTDDRIERAYHRYLRGLEEIAQLVPVGMFHEQQAATAEHPSVDAIHVFAQTPGGAPRALYQRKFEDGTYWTPWEPVPLDANAQCLLPVVRNGRKQLFWLEASEPHDGGEKIPDGAEPADLHVRLRVAASSFDGFEWSKPQIVDLGDAPSAEDSGRVFLSYVASLSDGEDLLVVDVERRLVQIKLWGSTSGSSSTYGLRRVTQLAVDPCSGALERTDRIPPASVTPVVPDRTRVRFGAFEQPQPYRLFGLSGGTSTHLLTAGATVTRGDMTVWRHENGTLEVPRGSFFTRVAGHWLFVQRSVLPSADPFDYLPGTSIQLGPAPTEAQALALAEQASYNVSVIQPKIVLVDLEPEVRAPTILLPVESPPSRPPSVRMRPFDHRLVCKIREVIHRHGLPGIRDYHRLAPTPLQELQGPNYFASLGGGGRVSAPFPRDHFDFDLTGAYSSYNWELFFHIPLFIATRLRGEGRYQEALDWIHAVFDPREAASSGDYTEVWKFRPFRELLELAGLKAEVDNTAGATTPFGKWLQQALGAAGAASGVDEDFEAQLDASEHDPFNPHRLARMRPVAYQKYVVRLYVETLVDWGDTLFRRDTIESLVEAQQLYMLAGLVLGRPPRAIDAPLSVTPKTFLDVEDDLDAFDNPIVAVEALLPEPLDGPENAPSPAVDEVPILLFCVPPNERMRKLWDLVQDRLFKLRNCMNIEGVERQLALFEPPIDPALLVRARAAGLDLDSILSDLYAPPPLHRFGVLYGRAVDFASFVVSLGQSLQAALEKKDAEALSLLQSEQQVTLLQRILDTRRAQVEEARENITALRASRATVEQRRGHYQALLAKGLLPAEESAQQKNERASALQQTASELELGAQMLHLIPDLNVGAAGMGPANFLSFGGSYFANALRVQSAALTMDASQARDRGAALSVAAGYTRRREDWELSREQAELELAAIDRQIIAAEVRLSVAEHELETQALQIEQSKEIRTFYEDKYTREELYTWISGELSGLYYDAYKLAFDMARRAERAFQFERAAFDRRFIQFGHWEGSRKGLLAGERLLLELRRMDAAYLESDRRERELTKHFSLSEMSPASLLTLRQTGSVTFRLLEDLFDLDYPGHYLRRIKSVSITLPAVTGPYSGVNATLTLLSNKIRISPAIGNGYPETEGADERFLYNFGAIQSICTSSGESDAGVFELRFDGERLVPFEGAGAVSEWRLEIPQEDNRFDLSTLTDAVIHVQYTARDAGGQLRLAARHQVAEKYTQARRLVSARYELPDAWHAFIEGEGESGVHVLRFTMDGRLPFIPGTGEVAITALAIAADFEPGAAVEAIPCAVAPVVLDDPPVQHELRESPHAQFEPDGAADETTEWTLSVEASELSDPEILRDVYFIFDLARGGSA